MSTALLLLSMVAWLPVETATATPVAITCTSQTISIDGGAGVLVGSSFDQASGCGSVLATLEDPDVNSPEFDVFNVTVGTDDFGWAAPFSGPSSTGTFGTSDYTQSSLLNLFGLLAGVLALEVPLVAQTDITFDFTLPAALGPTAILRIVTTDNDVAGDTQLVTQSMTLDVGGFLFDLDPNGTLDVVLSTDVLQSAGLSRTLNMLELEALTPLSNTTNVMFEVVPVPEPSTGLFMGMGLLAMTASRHRSRARAA